MAGPGGLVDLVAQLTLEEKASLTIGADFWHTAGVGRLGVPSLAVADGPHGLRKQPEDGDAAGIGNSRPATCFPTAATLGSSWDDDLVRQIGVAIGMEAAAEQVAVVLGPGVNIKRSALCGRNFEYLSEDPHVSGVLGAALVAGLQSTGTGACVKHFAANNQETDRLRISADVDERTLREIYLAAFERIVTTVRPWTVMCSYNKVNGVHASQNHWLLTRILRDEWGFDGLVMSDWGAVVERVPALEAGLDLEMPANAGISDAAIVEAVRSGRLAESAVDTAVIRLLDLVSRSKSQERPAAIDVHAHHMLARRAAAESAVLLENDGVLPLEPGTLGTVAVVGELARTPRFQGAGSSQVNPTQVDAALPALAEALPSATIIFAAGYQLDGTDHQAALADEAVSAARQADVVLCFLGLPADSESEGFDRTHMDLPSNQVDLLAQLAAVSSRVVVVLSNGSAVITSTWRAYAAAILECWLPGQGGGGAIADLLTGVVNPSGRLTETIPLALGDNPSSLNFPGELGHVRYGEGVFVGYRGFDAAGRAVSYPFGHGLSYTAFEFTELTISTTGTVHGGDLVVAVEFDVTNTGDVAGRTVAQVYVGDPAAAVARPPRELRGFRKVSLEPGQTRRVDLILTERDFAYWSCALRRWVVEGGTFTIDVGASSRDIALTGSINLNAPSVAPPLTPQSSLAEWLRDPAGGPALRRHVPADAPVFRPETLAVIGSFPVSRLLLRHLGLTPEAVSAALADLAAARKGG